MHAVIRMCTTQAPDATAQPAAVEAVFRRNMRAVRVYIPLPFREIEQHGGLTGSRWGLIGRNPQIHYATATEEQRQTETGRLVKLSGVVEKLAAGRETLFVTTKATRDDSGADWLLPVNIRVAHLGNLRGVNWAKDLECVIIQGRNLPYGPDLERDRACLPGEPVMLEISLKRGDRDGRQGRKSD